MSCEHLNKVENRAAHKAPRAHGCEECLKVGSNWVHLRLCLSCGHVGCCDDSPNRHATAHFHGTQHPVVKSFEPGENWAWCYVDEDEVEAIEAFPDESPADHFSAPAP